MRLFGETNRKLSETRAGEADLAASQHLAETHDARSAKSMIWILAIVLVSFGLWSSVTPVYEIVSGRGTILPDGLSSRIEHPEGGVVAELNVVEGDFVESGQVIMRFDSQAIRSELDKAAAQSRQLELDINRFQSLIDADLLNGLDEVVLQTWKEDDPTFEIDVAFRIAQIATLQSEMNVARTQQSALMRQRATTQQEADIQRAQLDRYLAAPGSVVARNRIDELRRETLQLEARSTQLEGEIAIQRASIQQMEFAKRELLAQVRREAALQIGGRQAELAVINQSRAQLRLRLERTTVKAKTAGVLQDLSVQDIGEVVSPGELIAEVVPANEPTFAEVEIAADRIGGVAVGSLASLKILTYDFTRYGDIEAVVHRISPSSFLKENGESVFRVQLTYVQNDPTQTRNLRRPISPGMTVVADIKSDRRTILSYLLKPVRVIADRALTEA